MGQIIFFDGVCNLCNASVDFIIRRDKDALFVFAPLQGERAKSILAKEKIQSLDSIILYSQGQVYEKSDAILTVLAQLGGAWLLVKVFWVLPRPLRDAVYILVAKSRYFLWGKKDSCRLPSEGERARFLP